MSENKLSKEEALKLEGTYVFDKKMVCRVCEKPFTTKVMKSSKARRTGSDMDLRPRFGGIDVVKYQLCSCPHCGYTAAPRNFEHISAYQKLEIQNKVCSQYEKSSEPVGVAYTDEQAIKMYELAQKTCEAKLGKNGEKGYIALNFAWLYRRMAEDLYNPLEPENQSEEYKKYKELEESLYKTAFDCLQMAMMNEDFPIMGLNEPTLEYIIAYMSYYFKKYDVAARMVSSVLTSSLASKNCKDNAYELKTMLIKAIKEKKEAAANSTAAPAKKKK